jgi:Fur family transcriptional regulator, ferric uptake regulator
MEESVAIQLRSHGYRMTPQRWAILTVLQSADCHLSPVEIYHRTQRIIPGMTEATVYRALTFLTAQDLVLAAHIGNGQLVYEISERAHHHLICRSCGGTLEIDHAALAELYQVFKERTGYQIDSLHTTFFGLCPACQGS